MIRDTVQLDTAHFAVMVIAEVVVFGLLAIVAVGCLIWLYDFIREIVRSLFR